MNDATNRLTSEIRPSTAFERAEHRRGDVDEPSNASMVEPSEQYMDVDNLEVAGTELANDRIGT